jgi:pyruvate-formate lyase-activating enzyme
VAVEEIAKLIANYGVSIIIVTLFIWDWFTNKKDMKETIEVIKDTSINISKSLDLLQKSMDRHDEKLDKLLESERK